MFESFGMEGEILVPKRFGSKKLWVQKNLRGENRVNNNLPKKTIWYKIASKIVVQNNFGLKKMCGPKNFDPKKYFGQTIKIFRSK